MIEYHEKVELPMSLVIHLTKQAERVTELLDNIAELQLAKEKLTKEHNNLHRYCSGIESKLNELKNRLGETDEQND